MNGHFMMVVRIQKEAHDEDVAYLRGFSDRPVLAARRQLMYIRAVPP